MNLPILENSRVTVFSLASNAIKHLRINADGFNRNYIDASSEASSINTLAITIASAKTTLN